MALSVSRRRRHWSRQTQQLRELRRRRTVGWWWREWGRAGDTGGCAQSGWCQGFADGGRVGTPTKLALLVALKLLAFSLMCVGSGLFLEFLRGGNVTVQHALLRVSGRRANQAVWAKRQAEPTKSVLLPSVCKHLGGAPFVVSQPVSPQWKS